MTSTYTTDSSLLRTPRDTSFGMEMMRLLATVIVPPFGVFLRIGLGPHFWLNLVLTMVGYLPGLVHGVWLLAQTSPHKVRIEHWR